MKFGLVLCTYGRPWDVVEKFIQSLISNDYENWELIIVDQNESDEIEKGLLTFCDRELRENKIKYFRVAVSNTSL